MMKTAVKAVPTSPTQGLTGQTEGSRHNNTDSTNAAHTLLLNICVAKQEKEPARQELGFHEPGTNTESYMIHVRWP